MTQTIGNFLLGKFVVVFCHQISGPKRLPLLMVQHVVYTWYIMIYTNWFHGDRFFYVPRFQLSSQMVEPWNRALTGPRSVVWRLPSRRSSSARWCSCRWPGAVFRHSGAQLQRLKRQLVVPHFGWVTVPTFLPVKCEEILVFLVS